ncbi:MAG: SMC family ATPase [Trueperaceae bacterium]|nr:MAG: SMC family ATPase [Trueperaceae bacterium]
MTPLKLELSGFGCFRELAVIDFEDLKLFAIAGPTGSGKSTLLDALTYALYGQTARLGSRGLDALFTSGSDRLTVRLSFSTQAGIYRVTRTADRKANGNIQRETRIEHLADNADWHQLPESERLRVADARLEQLIGLDYEGFTRAVLLPQGAFDEFLQGDATKRRKLLSALLGMERIEAVQREAFRRSRDAESRLQSFAARLEEDYAGATTERLGGLKEELARLEGRGVGLRRSCEVLADEVRELAEIRELTTLLVSAEESERELASRKEEMARAQQRYQLGLRAQMLMPQLRQLESMEEKVRRLVDDCKEVERSVGVQEKVLEEVDARSTQARERERNRVPRLEAELDKVERVIPLMSVLRSRGGTLDIAKGTVTESSFSESAWEEMQQLHGRLPSIVSLDRDLSQAIQRVESGGVELSDLEEQLQSSEKRLEELERVGKEAKRSFDSTDRRYHEVLRSNHVAALRSDVKIGDLCPVCGQRIAELVEQESTDVEDLFGKRVRAEQQLSQLRTSYQEARDRVSAIRERLANRREAHQQVRVREAHLSQELERVLRDFKGFDVERVDQLGDALEKRRRALLAALAGDIVRETGGEDPVSYKERLTREKQQIEATQRRLEIERQEAYRDLERVKTRYELLTEQVTALHQEVKDLEGSLAEAIAEAGFEGRTALSDAAISQADLRTLEHSISTYRSEVDVTARKKVELKAGLAGRTLDESRFERVTEELECKTQELEQVQRDQGRLQREVQQVAEQLERAKEIRRQQDEERGRFDTFRQLHLDLRGNAFPDYLMTQVQHQLVKRASSILAVVTDGRFDLRLFEAEYHVVDNWHGGDLRSAKTLSGGETFVASLALALALSDTLVGSHSLGALFLDEGFGTLDQDTLDAVANVLEALTREGRMVGVITHVTDLTERLPARLLVGKGPQGSTAEWDFL